MKIIQNIYGVVIHFFFASALFSATVLAAGQSFSSQVYKTLDERGNVVFTDQPTPEARPVDLQEVNTLAPVPDEQPIDKREAPKEGATDYSVVIASPEDQQLFPNRLLAFEVVAEAVPELESGQQFQLLIDGSPHSMSDGRFTVERLDVGEHVLQVEIIAADGKVIGRSQPITIFARQPG